METEMAMRRSPVAGWQASFSGDRLRGCNGDGIGPQGRRYSDFMRALRKVVANPAQGVELEARPPGVFAPCRVADGRGKSQTICP